MAFLNIVNNDHAKRYYVYRDKNGKFVFETDWNPDLTMATIDDLESNEWIYRRYPDADLVVTDGPQPM